VEKDIFVYVDLQGTPRLAERLWTRLRKNRESATFEYDKSWLAHPDRFSLEPALKLEPGPFHTPSDQPLFGAIGDSAPDRWGRGLMRRAERSWEAVALTLAAKAGIQVPRWRMETISKKSVLLVRRFDRANGTRLPFLSAMSMLEAKDNDQRSYLEFVDALRQHGGIAEGGHPRAMETDRIQRSDF